MEVKTAAIRVLQQALTIPAADQARTARILVFG
jgi:hypothetical protein